MRERSNVNGIRDREACLIIIIIIKSSIPSTADYRPRIYTDGSYKELDHDLHTINEETAVRKQAQAGVVIVHDGPDWKDRSMITMHIRDGEDIGARSAYTTKYNKMSKLQQ